MRNSKAELSRRSVLTGVGVAIAAGVVATTPASAATTLDLSATYGLVFGVAAPVGDSAVDQGAIQAQLTAAEAAGGGIVMLQWGVYRITGLDIGAKVALVGQGDGTILRLDSGVNRPAIQSKNYLANMASHTTMDSTTGVPFNIRLENLRLECNGASNDSTSHGIALYAFRTVVRNVYIYDTGGDGFRHDGAVGASTGPYPDGQVETILENIWIRQSRGIGFNYRGTNDAYADKIFVAATLGTADGAHLSSIDVGYMHVYGAQIGVVLNGNARIDHCQTENNRAEGLVSSSNGTITNSIRRLTCFTNWTGGVTDPPNQFSVRINSRGDLGDAMVYCAHGESGISVVGSSAANTKIDAATINAPSSAPTTVGLFVNANRVDIAANVNLFPTAFKRYSNNSIFRVRAINCPTGYYEPDATGAGNIIDFTFNATSSAHVPWVLPTTLPPNIYRLISSGSVAWELVWDGQNDGVLDAGEVTNRRPQASSVATVSGTLQLTYFTAKRNLPLTKAVMQTGGVAAGATPTLCRMGIWSIDSTGAGRLVASTPNDTTLFAARFATVTKALSASWTPSPGKRYAFGLLIVSAAAMPQFYGNNNLPAGEAALHPRLTAQLAAQVDLPSTFTGSSLAASAKEFYARVS